MNKLYNYLFHFSHHKEEWAAIPRGKEKSYFNGERVSPGILRSKNINTLIDIISGGYLDVRKKDI